MYTSGWLSRGPNGVIATTMYDAYSTADLILQDRSSSSSSSCPPSDPDPGAQATLETLLKENQVITWNGWERIDLEERRRGAKLGKPREKMTDLEEMVRFGA